MSTPTRYVDAIHIGTGEFSFCVGARTVAQARPPNGFRDLGNVKLYQLRPIIETFNREGAYRGHKLVDASIVTKRGFNYLFRCDELTLDNLRLLALGDDAGTNVRATLAAAAADTMSFTPAIPTRRQIWYDVTLGSVEQTHLTAIRLSVAAQALVEGEHFVVDLTVGRVRFLQEIAEDVFVELDGPEITADSPEYMQAVTPMGIPAIRGIGRFLQFRSRDEQLGFDHRGFSCLLSAKNLAEQNAKAIAPFDLEIFITEHRGTMWIRSPQEAFPVAEFEQEIPLDMLIWLKADAIEGHVDGQNLVTWEDQSGYGNDATAGTTPKYRTNQINGLPAVQFITDDVHFLKFDVDPFQGGETGAEIFFVFKVVNDPPAGVERSGLHRIAGVSDTAYHFPFTDGSIYDGFASTARKTIGNPTPSLEDWRVYNTRSEDGSWVAMLDGAEIFSTATNTFTSGTGGAVGTLRALGKNSESTTVHLDGYIAEVIMYGRVLTTEERDQVELYLANKYALTLA